MAKRKEKKPSSKPSKKWEMISQNRKHCPKCGKGVYLAQHSNPQRNHCGKCSYVEYNSSQ